MTPPAAPAVSSEVLSALAARVLGTVERIEALPGGASTRAYLRVHGARGTGIAMFVPEAAPPGGPTGGEWPFLEVRRLLEGVGVRVPKLLADGSGAGLLLLEDLGDLTLDAFLRRSPEQTGAVYDQAVRDLARAQKALAALPKGSVVGTRALDETLLGWELQHYREWGLEARGVALTPDERRRWDELVLRLAARLAALPKGFVHRDYQSRNLMVLERGEERELAWIDFQDALLGPRVYDLVALLCDSYQTFDDAFWQARLDAYAGALGLEGEARASLEREFFLVAVQRKLKDAGRFVFIDRVKGNPGFLPYFEPTRSIVRRAAARLEADPDVRELVSLAKLDA